MCVTELPFTEEKFKQEVRYGVGQVPGAKWLPLCLLPTRIGLGGRTCDGAPMEALNETVIVLIPTIKDPRKVMGYRLISLCNVVYNIITKTIAKLKTSWIN